MPDIFFDVDTALTAVPLNKFPVMDVDGLTVDTGVVYNEAGLSVEWNFCTSAGVFTHTAVTPTDTAGDYDFVNQGEGMYTIEIPASGGASINNNTEGYGWFSCNSTATLPWISPIYGFRAAAVNDALCDGGDVLDVSVTEWLGTAAATPTTAGVPEVDVTYYGGTIQTTGKDVSNEVATILLDTGELQTNQGNWLTATGFATPTNITAATGITVATMGANTITAASIATGAIDADAIAADAITAAKIATDAIGGDEIAADAVTEIQSGLATSSALATVDANVDIMVSGIITGQAQTGTLTTTSCTTDLSGYTIDQLIGRTLTWTSGVVDGEQTDITDYVETGGTLTYTLMTLAPQNGDTFKIT